MGEDRRELFGAIEECVGDVDVIFRELDADAEDERDLDHSHGHVRERFLNQPAHTRKAPQNHVYAEERVSGRRNGRSYSGNVRSDVAVAYAVHIGKDLRVWLGHDPTSLFFRALSAL